LSCPRFDEIFPVAARQARRSQRTQARWRRVGQQGPQRRCRQAGLHGWDGEALEMATGSLDQRDHSRLRHVIAGDLQLRVEPPVFGRLAKSLADGENAERQLASGQKREDADRQRSR